MNRKIEVHERLKDLRVVTKGLTLEELAEKTDLSKSALGQYESGEKKDISPHAIVKLADFYEVSTDYLLGVTEMKNHANTELHSLHLRDEMIDLLRSGKINNRLLCELVLHPGFARLMLDIEVCVDRIADMRITDMNQLLEAARQTIIQKHAPEENDLYLRTLELAQVSEDMFYSHVIHEDLDAIVKDIRTAHINDGTAADVYYSAEATTEEVQQMWEDAMNYNGTIGQKRAYLVCQTLKIDYDKLSQEDQKAVERIAKKSPILTSAISQRGRGIPTMGHGKGNHKKKKR